VLPKPPQQFDAASISVFDENFDELTDAPKRPWSENQLYAYRNFHKTNLSDGGMHNISVGINEAMKCINTFSPRTLFFERRKAGPAAAFSKFHNGRPKDAGQRMEEEDCPMFSGFYCTHHPSDEIPLEYGYQCDAYWEFCQKLVETHFNIPPNTLQCRVLRELDPLQIELKWPERSLRFRIWCNDKLHRVDDLSGAKPVFHVYAVWNICVHTMRE
jgi:hypothetical protein